MKRGDLREKLWVALLFQMRRDQSQNSRNWRESKSNNKMREMIFKSYWMNKSRMMSCLARE